MNRPTFVGRFFMMTSKLHYHIYTSTAELPYNWDQVAVSNAFLQTPYLRVLEQSAPSNMACFFIGIYEDELLIGVALVQYLDVQKLHSFGKQLGTIQSFVRNFALRQFASHVLFIGNNMITGQNGYALSKNISYQEISRLLRAMADELVVYFKKKGISIHVVSFKDFYEDCTEALRRFDFKTLFNFTVQPNMILNLRPEWKTKEDYNAALTKKYRDQFKRAQKKFEGINYKALKYEDLLHYEEQLYALYHHVAINAPFNTFFLAKNHFSTFKKQVGDHFLLFGYFYEDKLIGFHTLLLNGTTLETYFLGYDAAIQKEKMVYLNMLYNMIAFGIENQLERIIFGRTAMEIKSSIGALPIPMYGFMYHTQPIINRFIPKLFKNLQPPAPFELRHPFKTPHE